MKALGIGLVVLGVALAVANVALGASSGNWAWFGSLIALNALTVGCGAYIVRSN